MRDVLNEMQSDPSAAAKHMANPEVAKKIEMLIASGIIQTR
jgi:stress-induced-phosphoprotein 1